MRIITLAAMAVAFLSTASAKWSIGACDQSIEGLTFEEYEDFFATIGFYQHKVMVLDRGFFDIADTLEALGFVFPLDWKCEDLAEVSPFKDIAERQLAAAYDDGDYFYWGDEDFELFFPDRSDALLKLVRMDDYNSIVEVIYACADPFSLPAALVEARAFGLDTSDSSVSLIESLNAFGDIIRKLNLVFKLHGGIVLSDPDSSYVYGYGIEEYEYLAPFLKGYYYHEMTIVDQSLANCPADV